jgi:hypothetical protein
MNGATKTLALALAAVSLTTGARAAPVVAFYSNEASFLSAVSSSSRLDFEGLVSDTTFADLGPSSTIGGVTFTARTGVTPVGSPANVTVIGKSVPVGLVLGAPFDSSFLTPSVEPSALTATLAAAGGGFTAVGGTFLGLFGQVDSTDGILTLTGTSGVLDLRTVAAGIATQGRPKTFFGYTVSGDTIVSIDFRTSTNGAVIDNFTFGVAIVPEPRSAIPATTGVLAGLACWWRRQRRDAA